MGKMREKSLLGTGNHAAGILLRAENGTDIEGPLAESMSLVRQEQLDIRLIRQEVCSLISSNDEDKCREFADKYSGDGCKNSGEYFNVFAHCVICSIQTALLEQGKYSEAETGVEIWNKLAQIESVANPKQWILDTLTAALQLAHPPKERDVKEKLVNDVKNIIAARYGSHLSAAGIAGEMFFSPKYLNKIFKTVVGKSIFEYLTEYRMEKAKLLLKEEDAKIYAVSKRVGYRRKTHFNNVFKQYTGLKPLEYKSVITADGTGSSNMSPGSPDKSL